MLRSLRISKFNNMQRITPHLWYDRESKAAAEFYTSAFQEVFPAEAEKCRIKTTNVLHNTPSGSVDIVSIELRGVEFTMISAGPLFKFNPSISFLVACKTPEEVKKLWQKLAASGQVLMELGSYPFSPQYGWIQDKYGLSWQIMAMGEMPINQPIIPTIMFIGKNCGKAEEAINFYIDIFGKASFARGKSAINHIMRYEKGEGPDQQGTIKHAGFTLDGEEFAAMDSAYDHKFSLNEAVSLMVNCENQEQINYYWEKLSAVPEAEQCGWLKDRYGLSWQIVPTAMNEFYASKDQAKIARVTEAFLQMKKFDLAKLQEAAQKKPST